MTQCFVNIKTFSEKKCLLYYKFSSAFYNDYKKQCLFFFLFVFVFFNLRHVVVGVL